jgi:acyl-coenzyme A synthetase/AMP-(fatty) acid ligase
VVAFVGEQGLYKPMAYVVLKPDEPPSREMMKALQQHVRDNLETYKYPRQVVFVDELPRTPSGKLKRHVLTGDLVAVF